MGDPQMNCRENAETSREFVFCFSKVGELLRNKRIKGWKRLRENRRKPQVSSRVLTQPLEHGLSLPLLRRWLGRFRSEGYRS